MTSLPPVKAQLPEIKKLAKYISTMLYKYIDTPYSGKWDRINTNFMMTFHMEEDPDLYVIDNTLHIPVMSVEKLNNLPVFLSDIGYPFAIHHEVCHLLDLQLVKQYNLEMPSEEELEARAEEVEYRLSLAGLNTPESHLTGVC